MRRVCIIRAAGVVLLSPLVLTTWKGLNEMSDVKIPFELFADIAEYFLTEDKSTLRQDLSETIKEGVKRKCAAILKREDYAERIRQKMKEQDQE